MHATMSSPPTSPSHPSPYECFAIRVLHSCRIAAPVYLSILLTGTNEQVFKPTGPRCLSCLSSSRGVWACTTSTSGEISHIYASCSSTRPMKRRPKRTDKAELMAECQRQVQFGCWPAGRCCHRPRPPPTSPAAAAAKAHCTADQGTRPQLGPAAGHAQD